MLLEHLDGDDTTRKQTPTSFHHHLGDRSLCKGLTVTSHIACLSKLARNLPEGARTIMNRIPTKLLCQGNYLWVDLLVGLPPLNLEALLTEAGSCDTQFVNEHCFFELAHGTKYLTDQNCHGGIRDERIRAVGCNERDPTLLQHLVACFLNDEVPGKAVRRFDDDDLDAIATQALRHRLEARTDIHSISTGSRLIVELTSDLISSTLREYLDRRTLPLIRILIDAATLWSVAIAVVPEKTDRVMHFYERLPGPHSSIRAGNDPRASINGRSCARKPDDLEL